MDPTQQKHLWDGRQVKRANDPHYRANETRVARVVATIEGSGVGATNSVRVLNIGVGDARLERLLVAKGYDVYSLDPSADIVDWLRGHLGLDPEHARCGWSTKLPFAADFFDWVVMSEVIEHLSADATEQTLANVRGVLKRGGHLVGTVPENEDLALNRFTCLHCGKASHRVGHEQTFTVSTMRQLLARHFDVIRVRSFRGLFMNWRGRLYFHWIDLPYTFARLWKRDLRAPHQIVFNIFFLARKA